MSLTFADTHNMVAYLNKSDASEGFNQVINFLNGSYIKYALTVNPTIYVTCIKQFWNTVIVKQSNDVTRLQALVDKKKVVITEAAIRDALRLDDDNGVNYVPNEEIFAELARMGYEKSFTKLTFYKAFFSSQWKGRKFNFSKYIFKSLVRNVNSSSKFYMYPRFIQLIIQNQLGDLSTHTTKYNSPDLTQKVFANMRRVGKGFLRVETPLFEGMLVAGEPEEQEALDVCATLTRRVEHLEHDKVAQALEITKLKKRVKKLERANKEAVEVVTTAKLITEVVAAVSESVTAASATIAAVAAATIIAAPVRVAAASTRRRKGVGKGIMVEEPKTIKKKQQVEMDEEYARKLHEELNKDIDWSVAIDHVKQKAKEDSYVQRYQVMNKRPQTEGQARRNMIMYLKNVAGFRLDYFKGMSYDDIRPIFEAKFNSNIKFLLKTKEQLEEEENRHLEIVPDEDDDVYTEATLIARKVPVVDYQIIQLNNKPRYKIIRADGTHQLTMFERPDGQDQVWKSQRSVYGQAKLILLVERRYPLSRFTLDQMLNAVRLRVEEQSEMSLELLSATKQKLMLLDSAAKRRLMLLSQVKTVNDKCCC
nr:hypothetical protein [Tanacetum cinerariifolium]